MGQVAAADICWPEQTPRWCTRARHHRRSQRYASKRSAGRRTCKRAGRPAPPEPALARRRQAPLATSAPMWPYRRASRYEARSNREIEDVTKQTEEQDRPTGVDPAAPAADRAAYREVADAFPGVFKAGMGAEAVLDIVGKVRPGQPGQRTAPRNPDCRAASAARRPPSACAWSRPSASRATTPRG